MHTQNTLKFGHLILRKIIKFVTTIMSDFKAKMHQIQFRLGLPRRRWRILQRFPRSLPGFKGPTSKGGKGWGAEWDEERGGVGKGRKGRDREETSPGSCLHPLDMKSWIKHCFLERERGVRNASSSHFEHEF